jgi:hypothetical protein
MPSTLNSCQNENTAKPLLKQQTLSATTECTQSNAVATYSANCLCIVQIVHFFKGTTCCPPQKKTKTKLISTTPDYTPRCLLVQLSSCSNKNNTNNVRIEIATAKQLKHNNKLSPKRTNKLSSTNTNVCTYSKTNKGQQQFATKTMRFQKYAQPDAPTTNPMH